MENRFSLIHVSSHFSPVCYVLSCHLYLLPAVLDSLLLTLLSSFISLFLFSRCSFFCHPVSMWRQFQQLFGNAVTFLRVSKPVLFLLICISTALDADQVCIISRCCLYAMAGAAVCWLAVSVDSCDWQGGNWTWSKAFHDKCKHLSLFCHIIM